MKAVRNLELGRVDHGKGSVDNDHCDNGNRKAEVTESSTNLEKTSNYTVKLVIAVGRYLRGLLFYFSSPTKI